MKVCIIGLGPAGLFATKKLIDSGIEVIAIDKGKMPKERSKKEIVSGAGGAGLFSDGKLNFTPFIGGDLTEFVPLSKANSLIDEIDKIFQEYGLSNGFITYDEAEINKIDSLAAKSGIRLIKAKQKHFGSDNLVKLIDAFVTDLISKGAEIRPNTEAIDLIIKNNKVVEIITNTGNIKADNFIFAVGRNGSVWLKNITKKHNIETKALAVDIGVRVETSAIITKQITDKIYDPKLHIFTTTFDDFVRTFCTNPNGYVVQETYDNFINVNGHAFANKKSENTNFALLVNVKLTDPIEDSNSFGYKIGELANFLGTGKPILQRLGDLTKGRRSTWERINRNIVEPTLKDVVPGDISLLLPHRILVNIIEGLKKLDTIMPGIYSEHTLLYAPEIKLLALRILTEQGLKVKGFDNLFVAGDGAGLSHDIVNAAATGLICAEEIIKKNKYKLT